MIRSSVHAGVAQARGTAAASRTGRRSRRRKARRRTGSSRAPGSASRARPRSPRRCGRRGRRSRRPSSACSFAAHRARLVGDRTAAGGGIEVEQVDASGALRDARQRQVVAVAGADHAHGRAGRDERIEQLPARALGGRPEAPAVRAGRRRCDGSWPSSRAAFAAPSTAGPARPAGTARCSAARRPATAAAERARSDPAAAPPRSTPRTRGRRAESSATAAAASAGPHRRTGRGTGSR